MFAQLSSYMFKFNCADAVSRAVLTHRPVGHLPGGPRAYGPHGNMFIYIYYVYSFFIPAGEGPNTISLPGGPKWCKDGSGCQPFYS